jgi:hypothetical protein
MLCLPQEIPALLVHTLDMNAPSTVHIHFPQRELECCSMTAGFVTPFTHQQPLLHHHALMYTLMPSALPLKTLLGTLSYMLLFQSICHEDACCHRTRQQPVDGTSRSPVRAYAASCCMLLVCRLLYKHARHVMSTSSE